MLLSGRAMLNTLDERRHKTLPCEDGGVCTQNEGRRRTGPPVEVPRDN